MPSTEQIATAAAVGVLGGALCALWFTIAEAQGLASGNAPAARPTQACTRDEAAGNSAPRRTEASKPVVDATRARCP